MDEDATKPDCAADGFAKLDAAQFECPDWRAEVDASASTRRSSRVAQDTGSGTLGQHEFRAAGVAQDHLSGHRRELRHRLDRQEQGKAVYPEAGYTSTTATT